MSEAWVRLSGYVLKGNAGIRMKANGIFITGTDTEIGKDKLERINPICLL